MTVFNNKLLILGGTGFLGKNLINALRKLDHNCHIFNYLNSKLNLDSNNIIYTDSSVDLIDNYMEELRACIDNVKPDIVLNLAAHCGGIGYNKDNPVAMFEDNTQMIMNVFKSCYKGGVKKLINIGSVCSYPKEPPIPFKENDIWNGCPEITNAPYGIAKKLAFVLTDIYKRQYDFNSVNLICSNFYGRHDHFNSDAGHVIPDLITKMFLAVQKGAPEVVIWGSGKPTRDFLYVNDAVNIIIKFLENIDLGKEQNYNYINVGTGVEVPISMLVYYIAKNTGFKGKFIWDKSKPDGQPRRILDITRLKSIIGDYKFTNIQDGLKETIIWHKNFEG